MSKLAQPLREMVEPDQDYKKWYLFPMPGERKPSVMYKYEIDAEVLVKQRFRGHIEKMVKRLVADRARAGIQSTTAPAPLTSGQRSSAANPAR